MNIVGSIDGEIQCMNREKQKSQDGFMSMNDCFDIVNIEMNYTKFEMDMEKMGRDLERDMEKMKREIERDMEKMKREIERDTAQMERDMIRCRSEGNPCISIVANNDGTITTTHNCGMCPYGNAVSHGHYIVQRNVLDENIFFRSFDDRNSCSNSFHVNRNRYRSHPPTRHLFHPIKKVINFVGRSLKNLVFPRSPISSNNLDESDSETS
jgi:hypothetical protein